VVLVAAALAELSSGHDWSGTLALAWGCALSAGFFSGAKVHLGFRADGTRNARSDCSPTEASGGGILSISTEPDVGFIVGWLGLWMLFGRANQAALSVALVAVVAIVLFV
jgi:hypothetical protein